MKINTKVLVSNLLASQRFTNEKSTLPFLGMVKISGFPGKISITATILSRFIESTIECDNQTRFDILINPVRAADLVKTMNDNVEMTYLPISKTRVNPALSFVWKDGKTTLQGVPADDYPFYPDFSGKIGELEIADLKQAIKSTIFCASHDLARPNLNGIFIAENMLVASDGLRIAMADLPGISGNIIIPREFFTEILRCFDDEGKIGYQYNDSNITFSMGGRKITSLIVQEPYIAYENMKFEYSDPVDVSVNDWMNAVKQLKIFSPQDTGAIKIKINGEKVNFSSSNDLGHGEVEIDNRSPESPEFEGVFCGQFVSQFFDSCGDRQVKIQFSKNKVSAKFTNSAGNYTLMLIREH